MFQCQGVKCDSSVNVFIFFIYIWYYFCLVFRIEYCFTYYFSQVLVLLVSVFLFLFFIIASGRVVEIITPHHLCATCRGFDSPQDKCFCDPLTIILSLGVVFVQPCSAVVIKKINNILCNLNQFNQSISVSRIIRKKEFVSKFLKQVIHTFSLLDKT